MVFPQAPTVTFWPTCCTTGDDTRAVQILSNCRRAMAENGRVLIVERLIPGDPADALPVLLSDIKHARLYRRPRTDQRRIRQPPGRG